MVLTLHFIALVIASFRSSSRGQLVDALVVGALSGSLRGSVSLPSNPPPSDISSVDDLHCGLAIGKISCSNCAYLHASGGPFDPCEVCRITPW